MCMSDDNSTMLNEEFEAYLVSVGGLKNAVERDSPITSKDFFSIGTGWNRLVKRLIEELIEIGWDKRVLQVKEKYGTLRFYANSVDRRMSAVISKAETKSEFICEVCGAEGKSYGDMWVRIRCSECK